MPNPMTTKARSELGPEVFRREFHYRSLLPGSGIGQIGCGFFPRTDARPLRKVGYPSYFGWIYLLRGSGRVTHGKGPTRTVQAGDVIQLPPKVSFTIAPHRPVTWFEAFLQMDAELIQRVGKLCGMDLARPVLRIGLDPFLVKEFQTITSELARPTPVSLWGTLLRAGELVQAIHLAERKSGHEAAGDLVITKACGILQEDLGARLDLREVAARLGLGYHYFRRLFRRRFGISPGQYRIHCRLQKARAMLQFGEKNVSEVAEALGYPDLFVFSKQFKKEIGRPPSAFLP